MASQVQEKNLSAKFDYVKFDEQSQNSSQLFKQKVEELEEKIDTLPAGRYKSLALTALEECFTWIGKSIRDEQLFRDSFQKQIDEVDG